jgi:ParB-like nuclease domain
MGKSNHTPLFDERSLQNQLRRKSRRRREDLARLAKLPASSRAARNDALPQLELVNIGLDDFHLPIRKTRKCTPAHVREVMSSISELGFCDPVLVGKGNIVLDGEIRVEAAKALGLATVPCIRIDHLTDAAFRTGAPLNANHAAAPPRYQFTFLNPPIIARFATPYYCQHLKPAQ